MNKKYTLKLFTKIFTEEELKNEELTRNISNNLGVITQYLFPEEDLKIFDYAFENQFLYPYREIAKQVGESHENCRRIIEHCLSILRKERVKETILDFSKISFDPVHLPIEYLGLTKHTLNVLEKNKVYFVEQLLENYNYTLICSMKGAGNKVVNDIITNLDKLGISHNIVKPDFEYKYKKCINRSLQRIMVNYHLDKEQLIEHVKNLQQ